MYAQHTAYQPKGENWRQQIAGRYGSSDGILLFEDGRFALYGYATFILGSYNLNEDILEFKPDVPDLYSVFAAPNPALKDKTRIMFQGFQEGENYVQFDSGIPQQVFNTDANCFDWPFVYNPGAAATQFTFTLHVNEQDSYPMLSNLKENQWQFVQEGYNDLIFVFNKPTRYYLPFQGKLFRSEDGSIALRVSENFGERFLPFTPKSEVNEWEETLQMQKEMDGSSADVLYANDYYNMQQIDTMQYTLDQRSNLYIDRLNTEEGTLVETTDYHDTRFLRKYVKLKVVRKADVDIDKYAVNKKSIFYTTCEEPEKSYKSPNHRIDTTEGAELKIIPPVPLPVKESVRPIQ